MDHITRCFDGSRAGAMQQMDTGNKGTKQQMLMLENDQADETIKHHKKGISGIRYT